MVKSLSVALFKADSKDSGPISALLQRLSLKVHQVSSVEEARALVAAGESVDALLLPSRPHGATPAATVCVSVKADRDLAPLPLILLLQERDRESMASLYNFGADCVFIAPFDSELVRHQLAALARHREACHEAMSAQLNSEGLQSATVAALDAVREALVLLDVDKKLIFVNRSARAVLAFKEQPGPEEWNQLEKTFGSLVPPAVGAALMSGEGTIKRGDGTSFPALLRAKAMLDREGEIIGYALSFEERARLELLVNTADMAFRTRGLYLMTAAAGIRHLTQTLGAAPLAPLAKLEELMAQDPVGTPLRPLVTSLLEMLDALVSPDLKLSVRIESDHTIGMRFSELFQLAGLLVMHCLEAAGPRGEASLSTEAGDSPNALYLVAAAGTADPLEWEERDLLMEVMRGKLPAPGNRSKLRFPGLEAADIIAKRYQTRIEYKESGGNFKLRTKLPLV